MPEIYKEALAQSAAPVITQAPYDFQAEPSEVATNLYAVFNNSLLAALQAFNHTHNREISQTTTIMIEIVSVNVIAIEATVIVEIGVSEILMVLAVVLFPPRRMNPNTPRSKKLKRVS